MQITNMNGISKISADLSRMILSLDPLGDPMHILLRLDTQLVISGQYKVLDEMWDDQFPLGKPHVNHFQNPISKEYQYDECLFNIRNLPGWQYSVAISKYLRVNKVNEECECALIEAIEKWPFVLHSIASHTELERMPVWKKILSSKYISESRPVEGDVLNHISDIYGIVSCELWKRDELADLLSKVANIVVSSMESTNESALKMIINQRKEAYTNLTSSGSHLEKYSNAVVEDFFTEFTRFPPDVHPIDAQFLDPHLLERDANMHFRFPNIFDRGRNRRNLEREIARQIEEAFDDAGIEIDENNINVNRMVQEIIRLQQQGVMNVDLLEMARRLGMDVPRFQTGGRFYEFPAQRRLDPTLPLLQLFWMTFLPWFYV